MTARLTLGPILFHWPTQQKLDFYARIADEAPVDTVYLGEVICSKRSPYFDDHYSDVAERLERGGKKVVFSSLCEVMLKRERNMTEAFASIQDHELEVNDTSALFHMSGRAHRIGPLMNVYNEATLTHLTMRGATHVCVPNELPGTSVKLLAARAHELGVSLEVQVFGRCSLAISARCYHARAHGRTKDNCQFVCQEDADGMPLRTLDRTEFLAINGIQTLSHTYLDLSAELPDLVAMGVTDMRLSPHSQDMVGVATTFRKTLDRAISTEEAKRQLEALGIPAPRSNGFWHGQPGFTYVPFASTA